MVQRVTFLDAENPSEGSFVASLDILPRIGETISYASRPAETADTAAIQTSTVPTEWLVTKVLHEVTAQSAPFSSTRHLSISIYLKRTLRVDTES